MLASDGNAGRISAWAEEPMPSACPFQPTRAHLRVGGGTPPNTGSIVTGTGASPRGRRNPKEGSRKTARDGRISAWAEEPAPRCAQRTRQRAHLRVGGGTCERMVSTVRAKGASPRGRRNLRLNLDGGTVVRRISAWAEEP